MATYVNNLRLTELATGEGSGTWGTTTNTSLELIGEALGYNTQNCFSSDADATTTIADGATDPARAFYFKVTSSATLTATRTLTIAPNTISRVMFIENATTGSQSITISQGSGASVTIATGKTAVVYLDGAGSGAAVVDAMANVDPGVTDTLAEVLAAGNATGGTDIAVGTGDDITFADNSKVIFGAGSDLSVYSDGSDGILAATANLTLDVAGDINLDADGADINLKDGGTRFGILYNSGSDFHIEASVQDKDIKFLGNDGGSGITMLKLDASEVGEATFSGDVRLLDAKVLRFGDDQDFRISFDGSQGLLQNVTSNSDIVFKGSDAGSTITALTLDMSDAGTAIFRSGGVFNEDSLDQDFRVESNGQTHMLFVDAGNDAVALGTTDIDNQNNSAGSAADNGLAYNLGSGGYLSIARYGGTVAYLNRTDSDGTILDIRKDGSTVGIFGSNTARFFVHNNYGSGSGLRFDNAFITPSSAAGAAEDNTTDLGSSSARFKDLYLSSSVLINAAVPRVTLTDTDGTNTIGDIRQVSDATVIKARNGSSNGSIKFTGDNGTTETEYAKFDANGVFTSRLGAVFNEDSADVDFRVESNGNTHMLFVDAGNDTVVIGSGSISAPSTVDFLSYASAASGRSAFVHGSGDGGIIVSGSAGGSAASVIFGNDWGSNGSGFTEEYRLYMNGADDSLNFIRNANADTTMMMTSGGFVGINETSPDYHLHVKSGTSNVVAKFESTDSTSVIQFVDSGGNSEFGTTGSTARISPNGSYAVLEASQSAVVLNNASQDTDFRVESNNQANMLVVDASADKVGIGGSPADTTLTVRGANNSAGDLYTAVGAGNAPGIVVQNAGTTDNNNAAVFFKNDAAVVASIGARFNSHSTEETELRLSTTNSSGTTRERVFIQGDGDFGIGAQPSYKLDVQDSATLSARLHATGNNTRATGLYQAHDSSGNDINMSIGVFGDATRGELSTATNHTLRLYVNNTPSKYLEIATTGQIFASHGLIVNEDSHDSDFRVESDAQSNMLVVDAAENKVGINRSPNISNSKLEVGGADNVPIFNVEASGNTGGIGVGSTGMQFFSGSTKIQTIASDGSTFHDAVTITTGDNTHQLKLISTDADSNVGPVLELFRDSASPADGDGLGRMYFYGNNSAGEKIEYALIRTNVSDVTDATEDSTLEIFTYSAGAQASKFRAAPTETVLNESSKDVDFRVESDSNTHMLFVDAGNNRVGVGTNTPDSVFDVDSSEASASALVSTFRAGSDNNDNRANVFIGQDDNSRGLLIRAGRETGDRAISQFILNGSGGTIGSNIINALEFYEVTGSTAFQTTFNQDGENVDLRVESDGNANMLFVDAGSNLVNIGGSAFGSNVVSIDAGRIRIQKTTDWNLESYGDNSNSAHVRFVHGGTQVGSITTSSSVTAYNTSSDARLKENIADADDAGELIDAIQVRQFDWIADGEHQRYGMIAQELNTVAPEAVSEGETEEDMMAVDYSKLVPMLVKEIQSLRARVAQLESN